MVKQSLAVPLQFPRGTRLLMVTKQRATGYMRFRLGRTSFQLPTATVRWLLKNFRELEET